MLVDSECKFAFKGQVVHVKSGKTRNLVTIIQGIEKGKVIGIVNFKIKGAEGLGFALESNYIKYAVNDIYQQIEGEDLI